MLQNLHIQNYALIEMLDIDFNAGFSVITGETGAGKSIILGALGMVLGGRSETRSIKVGATKCVVEATFDLSGIGLDSFFADNNLDFDGSECVIRRELLQSGKSRAFINDTPVSLGTLKELSPYLVDIHSQHQNLLAGDARFQLGVLDAIADNEELRIQYKSLFNDWRESVRNLRDFESHLASEKDNFDYLSFQLHEIDDEHFNADEQEELEAEQNLLEHAETIKQELYFADSVLSSDDNNLCANLNNVVRHLENIANVYSDADDLKKRLDSCSIELDDIAQEISSKLEGFHFDVNRLDEVNERLNVIYRLEKKHHVDSLAALLSYAEDIRAKIGNVENADEKLSELRKNCERLQKILNETGIKLRKSRIEAATKVESEMQMRLRPLGMPNVQFAIELLPIEPEENGMDKVSFRFSANKNTPLCDMAEVASGGEIARVMLSLKAMLAGEKRMGTILFDEIDTGVSGRIAETMALMMQEMSRAGRQIISITHLPQIAALGEYQYKVYKEENDQTTATYICRLSAEERVTEIARLLSGNLVTDAALENARELLKIR